MHGDSEGTSSTLNVFANIFISFIGSGVLGLPFAFKEAGIIEGILIMVVVGALSIQAMLLLLKSKEKILQSNLHSLSQGEIGTNGKVSIPESSIDYGEVGFLAIGNFGRYLVEAAIIISQVGFCCAYLIFIPENLAKVLGDLLPFSELSRMHYLVFLLPPLMLLCSLRYLKSLGPFSFVAQMANIFAFMVVLWFDMKHVTTLIVKHIKTVSMEGLSFFTGIAIYCFEGAGLVLSLEASTSGNAKNNFKKTFIVSLATITFLYILFGVCGYMSFGADTKQMITLNLPEGIFPKFVISCLCYSLFFTYPVMMFPVTKILDKRLCGGNGSPNKGLSQQLRGTILRVGVVVISAFVVMLIPNFSLLMAFVGSGCCTLLAFILPGIFHWKLCYEDMKWYEKLVDIILILFGVVGTVIGLQDALFRLHEYHTAGPETNSTSPP